MESNKNEMPKLEAGMIVEYEGFGLLLVLPSGDGLRFYSPDLSGSEKDTTHITKIYMKDTSFHYKAMFEAGNPISLLRTIWTRTPPLTQSQLKIAEIEATIDSLETKHVESIGTLREQLVELKANGEEEEG